MFAATKHVFCADKTRLVAASADDSLLLVFFMWLHRNSLQQALKVDLGHDVGFHLVHGPPLTRLVHGEGFHWLAIVVKLGQDALVPSGHQWT